MARSIRTGITRRRLLVAGGVGAGLAVAWSVWPRDYAHNLAAAEGESIFNAFLKIGEDGHVTVVVPQAEMGQGVWTSLPQALADELGADWRQVGVEPAPINPLYANDFLVTEGAGVTLPIEMTRFGNWAAREFAIRDSLMITAGSTSIRGFERRFREAGAIGRTLLCMAAADRWNVGWEECETEGGFVTTGNRRVRFGEVAAEAATYTPSGDIALLEPVNRPITGQSLPRLDLPSKVDGSARYASDVRLPDMMFASVRSAPSPQHRLKAVDREAANRVLGVAAIFENPRFAACVATNWWAANRGVNTLAPEWDSDSATIDDGSIGEALAGALDGDGERLVHTGDLAAAFAGSPALRATYSVAPAPHAALEPLTATARPDGDQMEIWAPTQAPGLMRKAVARAIGYSENSVTLYPMLAGGSFGRKLDNDAAVQAAIIARRMNRPIQLCWSREEDIARDYPRPPARARLTGKTDGQGRISVLHTRIAVPSAAHQLARRIMPDRWLGDADDASQAAVAGARTSYAIPNLAVEHMPVDVGLQCGNWRSVAHSYTAFFTECFVDELARRANAEPLSFRIAMLGNEPRLARCLTNAAMLAGWDGGEQGGGMGLAVHSAVGSHIALVVRLQIGERQRPVIETITAAVDCGRIINPEIVRQQIEGGIVFGMAAALGASLTYEGGEPVETNFDSLYMPLMEDMPAIDIELIDSDEEPGGISELAVPAVAPAIGNAIYAATGQRLRKIPFIVGGVV